MFRPLLTTNAKRALCLPAQTTRAFHSPFAVLSAANTAPNPPVKPAVHASSKLPASVSNEYDLAQAYEKKEHDVLPEPVGVSGARTYVVSDPDPTHAPFGVKSGAFLVSEPFATA